jgi:hypothetical protein
MTLRYETRSRVSTYTQSWVGGEPDFGVFESIATTTVGSGGTSTITFSSIPSTYKHLQIRFLARGSNGEYLALRMNSDTGSNYSFHRLSGEGSSASANASTSRSDMILNSVSGTSSTANIFNVGIVDILDYADTNKYKTVRVLTGVDFNGSGSVELISNNWRSSSAITTLTITQNSSGTIQQYSSFALYGIKG